MTKRIFWDNPYINTITAKVLHKQFKDNKYHLTTDKTIFYPNGSGGQLGDVGSINGVDVEYSYESTDRIVHVLKKDILTHEVNMQISSKRRFDLCQQHSGQHLLSAVFSRLLEAQTIGFHMGEEHCTIDLDINLPNESEISRVEEMANSIIQANFPIKAYEVDEKDLKYLPIRKEATVQNTIRIIEIDSFDYSPCGGTHVFNTGELGLIKLTKLENYKNGTRVHFLVGKRAFNDYCQKHNVLKKTTNLLSIGEEKLFERVEALRNDLNSCDKKQRLLIGELYKYMASEIYTTAERKDTVSFCFKEFLDLDFKELTGLINTLTSSHIDVLALFVLRKDNLSQFILSKSKELDIDLKDIFKLINEEFSIKGGGNSNTLQGSINTEYLEKLVSFIRNKY